METRRCPDCHKLQRASAQKCSRCGHKFARKQVPDLTNISQPSLPIASPHRAGHYFGLHPEDQPYQSRKLISSRSQEELHEHNLYEGQEPKHIVFPSTDSIQALKSHRQEVYPPRPAEEARKNGQARTPIPAPVPMVAPHLPLKQHGSALRISRRTFSLVLIILCVFFLLIASIITLDHLNATRLGANASLKSLSATVRANDVFILQGEKWVPHARVVFTYDDQSPLTGEDGRAAHVQANDQGFFRVHVQAKSTWSVGTHTLHAIDPQQKLTVDTTITVQAVPEGPPSLALSVSTLDLGAAAAGVVSEQSITLTNQGGGQLNWQASSDQPWLTVSPGSGTFAGHADIQISVNRGSLAPDQYTGLLEFSQQSQVLKLTVTMEVSPDPVRLAVSPTSLTYSASAQQNPVDQNILVRNDGSEAMNWSASASTSDGADWFSLTPMRGTLAPGTLAVLSAHVDSHLLTVGTYSALVAFAGDASASVRVTVSVVAPGNLVISPPTLSFTSQVGQPAAPQSLTLQNSGGQALDWSVTVATQDQGSWATVTPKQGTLDAGAQTMIQVSASAESLSPGAYQGTITVKAGTLTKTVPLSFTVTAPAMVTPDPATTPVQSALPAIQVQPATLQIYTVRGQQPATLSVRVINAGQAVLNWEAQVDSASPFVQVSPAQGNLDPGQSGLIMLTVDVSQASAGTLSATITVADADGNAQVVSRKMQLIVVVQDI